MKKLFALILSLQFLLAIPAMAQDNSDDIAQSTQNDLFLVAGAGAAGAILGLSTLSFMDKPSQHISNIWTGAAIGVIAGVVLVVYNSAQKNQEDLESSVDFQTHERVAWHFKNNANLTSPRGQFGTQIWGTNF